MTQEEKELLLKDLSARLPYGIKAEIKYYDGVYNLQAIYTNGTTYATRDVRYPIETYFEDCKPYLFPLSSMTEEQKNDLFNCCYNAEQEASKFSNSKLKFVYDYEIVKVDWFNKNHFDYRGLIEKDLALDATGLNIY